MKLYIKLISILSVTVFLATCSKKELNENAPHIILADNLYTTKAGFQNGLNGLYDEVRRMRSGAVYGSVGPMMLEAAFIGVDNGYGNWRDAPEDVFNYFGAFNNPTVVLYSQSWAWLYETINAANTIIHRAELPGIDWTTDDKNSVVAEARCIRAWCYRHLTYLWGDVPLTLDESSGTNIKTDWQRTPVAEIRKAMEADWLFAEQYLPVTATSDARLLKGIAQHYLAELYLATDQPQKAKDMAIKVTQNTNYKLVTARYGVNKANVGSPFSDMFIEGNSKRSQGNTEALWILQNELSVIGGEGNNLMRRYWVNRYYSLSVGGKTPIAVSADNGGRGIGRLGPTRAAMNFYGAGDDRGSALGWRLYFLVNNAASIPAGYKLGDTIFLDKTSNEKITNANWPNTRKWDYASPIDPTVDRQYNDQILLRTADTWLLLAEANFKLNDLQGAADAINAIRTRSKAPAITAAQVTLDFILDERSRELFSEEERRYTLLRTGKWLERTKLYNKIASPTVADRDKLLPIPQDVIDANRTSPMPQNPGY